MALSIGEVEGVLKLRDDLSRQLEVARQSLKKAGVDTKEFGDATAVAGKQTETFSGQLRSLAAALGVTISVGAVVAFGRELLRWGDELVRISDRTGMTIDQVQRLGYVTSQTGNDIGELTAAIGQMQNRLASGDESAIAAIKGLGISFKDLQAAGPYEQLQMIAAAVARVPGPADQARLAMDLFGRAGIAILPTLKSNFAAMASHAAVMSDKTVKALDATGDAIERFKLSGKVMAAEAYNWSRDAFERLIAWCYRAGAAFYDLIASVVTIAAKIPGASAAMKALGADVGSIREKAQWYRDAAKIMVEHTDQIDTTIKKVTPSFTGFGKGLTKAAAEAKKLDESISGAGLAKELTNLEASWRRQPEAVKSDELAIGRVLDQYTKLRDQVGIDALPADLERLALSHSKLGLAVNALADGLPELITESDRLAQSQDLVSEALDVVTNQIQLVPSFIDVYRGALIDSEKETVSWGETFTKVMGSIPQLVISAFTGGGGVIGALQGIGSSLGAAIGQKFGEGLAKAGSAMSSALGSIFAALGSLAGPLISGIAYLWKGGAGHEANVLRDQFTQQFGPDQQKVFVELQQKLDTVGQGFLVMQLKAASSGDRVKAVTKEITDALDKVEQENAKIAAAFDGVASAGKNTFGVLTPAIRDHINDLLTMNGLTDDQRAKLQGMLSEGAVDYRGLAEQASKYGITLEGLGPKFQQNIQNMDWGDLFNTWELLTNAGGDYNGMLAQAAPKINEMVQAAMKAGTTIPDSMKPILQSLAEQGLLTDEQGNKLKDLSGIGFAPTDPLPTALNGLNQTLLDLIDLLKNGVPQAVSDLANVHAPEIRIPVRYDYEDEEGAFAGSRTVAPGEGAQYGRVVSRPSRLWIGEGGQPEIVGPIDFMTRALTGAIGRTGGGGVIHVHVHTHLGNREVAEEVIQIMPSMLKQYGVA